MKQVLSIQDLSCLGRCSLTVTLPVISALGSQCTVLPTALLSTHTGFPHPHVQPLTEQMSPIAAHWRELGVSFDAVGVGYLANESQAQVVLSIVRQLREQGSLLLVDPAMGDHGSLYRGLTPDHVGAMSALCRHADIILPNVTEAALLTGLPYRDRAEDSYLRELGAGLRELGVGTAIITGFLFPDGQIGFYGTESLGQEFSYRGPYIGKKLHGTGDLFAAVFLGARMAGQENRGAATLAAEFVRRCVEATPAVTPYGVEFERQLPYLLGKT